MDKYSNPGLPSYKGIWYRKHETALDYCWDAWHGKKNWTDVGNIDLYSPGKFEVVRTPKRLGSLAPSGMAHIYLPRGEKEPLDLYTRRLSRSLYKNFYRKIIEGFAGVFTDFTLDEVLPSIEEWVDDVDNKGTTLKAFIKEINALSLRDGYVGIKVEFAQRRDDQGRPIPVTSRAVEKSMAGELRPYFEIVLRKDILNFQLTKVGSRYVFERIVMEETTIEPDPDNEFGDIEVTRYREVTPEGWRLLELIEDGERTSYVEVDSGANALGVVPIIPYSITHSYPIDSDPATLSLAEYVFSYYDLYSSYREVMARCNLPQAVRVGMVSPDGQSLTGDRLPPLYLGTSSVIDVPEGGDFKFVEPSGAALQATRDCLTDLVHEILAEGLSFMSRENSSAREKTQTQVDLEMLQIRSQVEGMAANMESCMEMLFYFWGLWTKEIGVNQSGGTIKVNRESLRPAMDVQAASIMNDLMTTGMLSRESGLKELKVRGFFSTDFDVDEEIATKTKILEATEEGLDAQNEAMRAKGEETNARAADEESGDNAPRREGGSNRSQR